MYEFSTVMSNQKAALNASSMTFLDPTKSTEESRVFKSYIVGGINDIDSYIPLLQCLVNMRKQDAISIYIDSPGGYINAGASIASHILNCKGHVTTIAVGFCASAGSLIWSAGHKCLCSDAATFMWHMSSHQDRGNSLNIRDEANLQVEYVKKQLLAVSLAKGHITNDEVEYICSDTDASTEVWITAPEMNERILKYNTEGTTNE